MYANPPTEQIFASIADTCLCLKITGYQCFCTKKELQLRFKLLSFSAKLQSLPFFSECTGQKETKTTTCSLFSVIVQQTLKQDLFSTTICLFFNAKLTVSVLIGF